MPELPEVETVCRGLAPHLVGHRLRGARVREARLRWPVPEDLGARVSGHEVVELRRRGKYLVMRLRREDQEGYLLLHLGMSGSLRLTPAETPPERHDHVDLLLEDGQCLRLRDPRRFGALLWCDDPSAHPLIAPLGVEPLSPGFDGAFLHALCRGSRLAIKALIMDAHRLVGVGNIYANEALFHAGIDPRLAAGRLSRPRCERLAGAIRETLTRAIAAGGSTLRDFVDGHGKPGYFQQTYFVYGRAGEPCRTCGQPIRHLTQGARSTFFCAHCQKR
ncbi:MAG: bifunctional DNA-formamidopyrimidine glycosylase/DNA-(apurinic or apyrimidinic site) lyase [Pseudomonadota bacterium]